MKNITILVFLIIGSFSLNAQKELPISIAYFSNFGFQPGIKIGTHFDLKEWGGNGKDKSFFISPQLGFYSQIGNSMNVLVNADFGYKRVKTERGSYVAFSGGLGYLFNSELISQTISLSDGTKTKNRELRGYVLPSVGFEFGKEPIKRIGWYSKQTFGYKILSDNPTSPVFFIEVGIKFRL